MIRESDGWWPLIAASTLLAVLVADIVWQAVPAWMVNTAAVIAVVWGTVEVMDLVDAPIVPRRWRRKTKAGEVPSFGEVAAFLARVDDWLVTVERDPTLIGRRDGPEPDDVGKLAGRMEALAFREKRRGRHGLANAAWELAGRANALVDG